MTGDDDDLRQQQRREDDRREQQRRDERREQQRRDETKRDLERQAQNAREDLTYERIDRERESEKRIGRVARGDMEAAFAQIGIEYKSQPRVKPADRFLDPKAEAIKCRVEMQNAVGKMRRDHGLTAEQITPPVAICEMQYLSKIRLCLTQQLDQIAAEETNLAKLRLDFDPLGIQRKIHNEKLSDLQRQRESIQQELLGLDQRFQFLWSLSLSK